MVTNIVTLVYFHLALRHSLFLNVSSTQGKLNSSRRVMWECSKGRFKFRKGHIIVLYMLNNSQGYYIQSSPPTPQLYQHDRILSL